MTKKLFLKLIAKPVLVLLVIVAVSLISATASLSKSQAIIAKCNQETNVETLTVSTLNTLNATKSDTSSAYTNIDKILSSNNNRFTILGYNSTDGSPVTKFISSYDIINPSLASQPATTLKQSNTTYCFTVTKDQARSSKNYIALNISVFSSADAFYSPIKSFKTAMVNRM